MKIVHLDQGGRARTEAETGPWRRVGQRRGGYGMMRAVLLHKCGSDRPASRRVSFRQHGNLQKVVHNARIASRLSEVHSTEAIGRYSRTQGWNADVTDSM